MKRTFLILIPILVFVAILCCVVSFAGTRLFLAAQDEDEICVEEDYSGEDAWDKGLSDDAEEEPGFPQDNASPSCVNDLPQGSLYTSDLRDLDDVELYLGNQMLDDEVVMLVSYIVEDQFITDPEYFEDIPEQLDELQTDSAYHQELWEFSSHIIPPDYLPYIDSFQIVTDGEDSILASISQSEYSMEEWAVQVDVVDTANRADLAATIIHELAHLITLNASQVPPSAAIYTNPDNDDVYYEEMDTCPTFFPGEGCSLPGSYINLFFESFWLDIYDEWAEIDVMDPDSDTYYDAMDSFYQAHQDSFVSDYAPTDPTEDMAETFVHFVLYPKPAGSSIAEEKVLFFYQYPEIVEMRAWINQSLCSMADRE